MSLSRIRSVLNQPQSHDPKYKSSLDNHLWKNKDICEMINSTIHLYSFIKTDFELDLSNNAYIFIDYLMNYLYRINSKYSKNYQVNMKIGFVSSSFHTINRIKQAEILVRLALRHKIIVIPYINNNVRVIIVYFPGSRKKATVYRQQNDDILDIDYIFTSVGLPRDVFINTIDIPISNAIVPDITTGITDSQNIMWMLEVVYRLFTSRNVLEKTSINNENVYAREDWTMHFLLLFLFYCRDSSVLDQENTIQTLRSRIDQQHMFKRSTHLLYALSSFKPYSPITIPIEGIEHMIKQFGFNKYLNVSPDTLQTINIMIPQPHNGLYKNLTDNSANLNVLLAKANFNIRYNYMVTLRVVLVEKNTKLIVSKRDDEITTNKLVEWYNTTTPGAGKVEVVELYKTKQKKEDVLSNIYVFSRVFDFIKEQDDIFMEFFNLINNMKQLTAFSFDRVMKPRGVIFNVITSMLVIFILSCGGIVPWFITGIVLYAVKEGSIFAIQNPVQVRMLYENPKIGAVVSGSKKLLSLIPYGSIPMQIAEFTASLRFWLQDSRRQSDIDTLQKEIWAMESMNQKIKKLLFIIEKNKHRDPRLESVYDKLTIQNDFYGSEIKEHQQRIKDLGGRSLTNIMFDRINDFKHIYFYIRVDNTDDFDMFLNSDFTPDFDQPLLPLQVLRATPLSILPPPPGSGVGL